MKIVRRQHKANPSATMYTYRKVITKILWLLRFQPFLLVLPDTSDTIECIVRRSTSAPSTVDTRPTTAYSFPTSRSLQEFQSSVNRPQGIYSLTSIRSPALLFFRKNIAGHVDNYQIVVLTATSCV